MTSRFAVIAGLILLIVIAPSAESAENAIFSIHPETNQFQVDALLIDAQPGTVDLWIDSVYVGTFSVPFVQQGNTVELGVVPQPDCYFTVSGDYNYQWRNLDCPPNFEPDPPNSGNESAVAQPQVLEATQVIIRHLQPIVDNVGHSIRRK